MSSWGGALLSFDEPENGAPLTRPHTLSPSWLFGRAIFGLFVLFAGTFLSVWLYDATIKANASPPSTQTTVTRQAPLAAPIAAPRER